MSSQRSSSCSGHFEYLCDRQQGLFCGVSTLQARLAWVKGEIFFGAGTRYVRTHVIDMDSTVPDRGPM